MARIQMHSACLYIVSRSEKKGRACQRDLVRFVQGYINRSENPHCVVDRDIYLRVYATVLLRTAGRELGALLKNRVE